MSDANYELAYVLRKNCLNHQIELKLSTNIFELLNLITRNTKAVLIECNQEQIQNFSKYFSENLSYEVLFTNGKQIYNKQGILFNNFDEFVKSKIFKTLPIMYEENKTWLAIDKCYTQCEMIVNCWQATFIKEVICYMILNNKQKISFNELKLFSAKHELSSVKLYFNLGKYLKKYSEKIQKQCEFNLIKYDTRKLIYALKNKCLEIYGTKI